MKKILFITNIPNPYRQRFYNELAQYVDLTVIYEAEKAHNIDFADIEKNQYKCVILKKGEINEKRININIIKYLKEMKQYDDIVVTGYGCLTEMFAIIYLMFHKYKYIFELDGPIKTRRNLIKKIIFTHAKVVFSPSRQTNNRLHGYGIEESKIINYHFTSIERKNLIFQEISREEKRKLKEKLEIKEDIVLLYVGRIIYKKGIDLLVQGFKKTYGENKKVGLILVGNYYDKQYYELLGIDACENIRHVAFCEQDELLKYYDCADVFTFPTRDDPWGLVINEAIARGLPVVASDNCGAANELIVNNKNGFVVKDMNRFFECVDKLVNDEELRKKMSENNRKLSKECTIEEMVKKHVEYWKGEIE